MKNLLLILIAVITGVVFANDQPFPERGETAEEFLDRYGQWVDTIPSQDRAWDEVIAIGDEIEATFGSISEISSNVADDRWARTAKFVEENPEIIERIKRCSEKRFLGIPKEDLSDWSNDDPNFIPTPVDILLPHLRKIRDHAKLLAVDSILAARGGDLERAIDSMESIYRLQGFIPVSNAMIEGLVEIACSSLGSGILFDNEIEILNLNEEQLVQLQVMYVDNPLEMGASDVFENERWSAEELLQSFYKGSKGGRITTRGTQRFLKVMNLVYGVEKPGDLKEEAAMIRRDIAKYPAQAKVQEQFWTVFQKDIRQESYLMKRFESDLYIDKYSDEGIEFAPAVLFFQSPRRWYGRSLQYRASQNAMSLLIALHIHHLRNGSFPESYDELDNELLAVQPIDPYTGELLHFQIRDGRVVIYSNGLDRDDDGGISMLDESGEPELYPDFITLDEFDEINRTDPESIDGDWILYPLISE